MSIPTWYISGIFTTRKGPMAADTREQPQPIDRKVDRPVEPREDKESSNRAERSSVTSKNGRRAPSRRIIVPD